MRQELTRRGNKIGDRITVRADVHSGKPCVAGTRIPVLGVLELLREGLTFADIIRGYYPDLSLEDIQAWVQYAPVHRVTNESGLPRSPCLT